MIWCHQHIDGFAQLLYNQSNHLMRRMLMMSKRRVVVLLISLCLILAAVGCSKEPSGNEMNAATLQTIDGCADSSVLKLSDDSYLITANSHEPYYFYQRSFELDPATNKTKDLNSTIYILDTPAGRLEPLLAFDSELVTDIALVNGQYIIGTLGYEDDLRISISCYSADFQLLWQLPASGIIGNIETLDSDIYYLEQFPKLDHSRLVRLSEDGQIINQQEFENLNLRELTTLADELYAVADNYIEGKTSDTGAYYDSFIVRVNSSLTLEEYDLPDDLQVAEMGSSDGSLYLVVSEHLHGKGDQPYKICLLDKSTLELSKPILDLRSLINDYEKSDLRLVFKDLSADDEVFSLLTCTHNIDDSSKKLEKILILQFSADGKQQSTITITPDTQRERNNGFSLISAGQKTYLLCKEISQLELLELTEPNQD